MSNSGMEEFFEVVNTTGNRLLVILEPQGEERPLAPGESVRLRMIDFRGQPPDIKMKG